MSSCLQIAALLVKSDPKYVRNTPLVTASFIFFQQCTFFCRCSFLGKHLSLDAGSLQKFNSLEQIRL